MTAHFGVSGSSSSTAPPGNSSYGKADVDTDDGSVVLKVIDYPHITVPFSQEGMLDKTNTHLLFNHLPGWAPVSFYPINNLFSRYNGPLNCLNLIVR